jgi:predicted  nucleic acid-binding Zn ribbon protein
MTPCGCGPKKAVVLAVSLSRDELPCGRCGGVVPVDGIGGPRDVVNQLRRWVDQAFAIETLWFASAEYEDWAKGELDGAKSRLNQLGRLVAQKLTPSVETWHYSAPHAGGRQAVDKYLHHCPACHDPTDPTGLIPKFGLGCAKCRVAGSAE